MYLGGVPVFAIMMIGRWSSDAFMKYICKQIKIHFQPIQKDAHNATFQTRPKQSIKQPEQEGIWRVGQPDATKSMKVVKAPYLANQDRTRGLTIY
jgi:hypothetical protein